MNRVLSLMPMVMIAAGLVVSAHAAQGVIAGQCAGGGGSGAAGGMKLVGSIPASAAGRSSGGGYRLTGGFIAAAQVWGEGLLAVTPLAEAAAAIVSRLAALPTRSGGAQITFCLSAPATVEVRVLNVAGRPVRHLTTGRLTAAGVNSLVWSGCSDRGLKVPAGVYLADVAAGTPDGSTSHAVTTLRLGH